MKKCITAITISYYKQRIGSAPSPLAKLTQFWILGKRLRNGLASFEISRYVDPERIAHTWRFE